MRPEVTQQRLAMKVQVGRRLAAARAAAGCSQQQAADCLGLAQTAIAKLEQGRRHLGLLEALDLADLYGVPPEQFDPRRQSKPIEEGTPP
jgi:transcriptional regulator with XRE-family HTH domain